MTAPRVNLLTAGFPCQPFSHAGAQGGEDDPRGTVFEDIYMYIRRCLPDVFILENVKVSWENA